jgi:hypothetical protein
MSCPDDSSIEALEAIYEEAALADEADESLTTTEDCARAAEVRDKILALVQQRRNELLIAKTTSPS